jgi:hypothetical protein
MTPKTPDRRAPYVDAAIAELEYRACRYVRALDALTGAIATAADVEAEQGRLVLAAVRLALALGFAPRVGPS